MLQLTLIFKSDALLFGKIVRSFFSRAFSLVYRVLTWYTCDDGMFCRYSNDCMNGKADRDNIMYRQC